MGIDDIVKLKAIICYMYICKKLVYIYNCEYILIIKSIYLVRNSFTYFNSRQHSVADVFNK